MLKSRDEIEFVHLKAKTLSHRIAGINVKQCIWMLRFFFLLFLHWLVVAGSNELVFQKNTS